MRKFGKVSLVVSLVFCLLAFTGCEKNEDNKGNETGKNTVAAKLVAEFEKAVKDKNDSEAIANAVSESEIIQISVGVMPIEEGYLDGFDGEVKGFKNSYVIKPMIGSQPFVAYVFESDDASKLEETLKSQANKRWNICTEADDLETTVSGKYVFLVMSPSSFED